LLRSAIVFFFFFFFFLACSLPRCACIAASTTSTRRLPSTCSCRYARTVSFFRLLLLLFVCLFFRICVVRHRNAMNSTRALLLRQEISQSVATTTSSSADDERVLRAQQHLTWLCACVCDWLRQSDGRLVHGICKTTAPFFHSSDCLKYLRCFWSLTTILLLIQTKNNDKQPTNNDNDEQISKRWRAG
jgi:hypothetical protein